MEVTFILSRAGGASVASAFQNFARGESDMLPQGHGKKQIDKMAKLKV